MNFKVFVAVFGVLFAVQASSQSPALKDDSIKEIVIDVFTKGIAAANAVLTKAKADLDNFEQNEDAVKAKIIAAVVAEGKKINGVIIDVLEKLKDSANADGKAVLDCIAAEQDKTDAAFEKAATDLGTCIAGENDLFIAAAKDLLSQLDTLVSDVQAPLTSLIACSNDEALCLLTFGGAEYGVAQKIPAVVTEDIAKLKTFVETLKIDLSGCVSSVYDGVFSSAQEIFNEAVTCIKK